VTNVVRIHCIDSALSSDNETLPGADYQARIEKPILAYLKRHTGIDFIVLTKGVPIRIDGGNTGESYGFEARQESVDGALAALDYDKIPGATKIVFDDPDGYATGTAWLNQYWNANEPFSHAKFGGYIVTRLDAFTEKDARALTRRALDAEAGLGHGPLLLDIEPDFGIDDPNSQPAPITTFPITQESAYGTWNADMQHAANDLTARGIDVRIDTSENFVGGKKNLLAYWSWGSNDDHFSQHAYNSLGFLPGAIGDTAVSTSASSMLPPGSCCQSAIGDLIAQGITGVKGYIDEPLLQAISSPTIALDRYTSGYSLGESLAAASHFVGWTDLIIGDPLAHPYAATKQKRKPGFAG
jgi:uncharacterized protein (TIGR03790 family)